MKKALIDPRFNRICEFNDNPFPVAEPLFWMDVPNETTTEWEYDDNTKSVRTPIIPEKPVNQIRLEKQSEVTQESNRRLKEVDPEITSVLEAKIINRLWSHLKEPENDPDLVAVRDIYLHGEEKKKELRSATKQQLDQYDSRNDPAWPSRPGNPGNPGNPR
jgi:hypothetical protein